MEDYEENKIENAGEEMARSKKYYVNKRLISFIVIGCLILSCIAGAGGAAIAFKIAKNNGNFVEEEKVEDSIENKTQRTSVGSLSINEIAAKNENAVVEIRTESVSTDMWLQQYITQGAGSGVIVDEKGNIATNYHVIQNAKKIKVSLKNGKEYVAKVVGVDEDNDLAVIKIDGASLTPVVFGNSDELKVGDLAVAIGNPLGELGGTVTAGIISALDREINISGQIMSLLQTDASINPGNSGGGLFNQYGELIGIVVAKSTGSGVEGLGFAIPTQIAKDIINQIIENGYVKGKAISGMTYVDLTSTINAFMNGFVTPGIYVKSVDTQNAINAGFKKGDMIYKVGDMEITSAERLKQAFAPYGVGDTVKIDVVRSGQVVSLNLIMSEKKY